MTFARFADRVLQTSTTTGTGALVLSSAVTGYRDISAAYAVDEDVPYAVVGYTAAGAENGEYEVGRGHLNGSGQLVRDAVFVSSNGNALVAFVAASLKVFVTAGADALQERIAAASAVVAAALDSAHVAAADPHIGYQKESEKAVANGYASLDASTLVPVAQLPITPTEALTFFGSGNDGNVTINSAVTLTRDMYYDTLTIAAGGALATRGFRVHCKTALDLSNAPAGSIRSRPVGDTQDPAGTAGSAAGGAGVAGGFTPGINSSLGMGLAAGFGAGNGGAGGTAAGTAGQAAQAGFSGGGAGGAGGVGGTGSGGAGGAAGSPAGGVGVIRHQVAALHFHHVQAAFNNASPSPLLVMGGQAGAGGGGGGGDGTAGGGGGGGGAGGDVVGIYARTIITSVSTPAGVVVVPGGTGGAGGSPAAGNRGGGAGGGGGGGGWIYVLHGGRTGPAIVGALSAPSGAGGAGGNGSGTGTGGRGGASGFNGRIWTVNLATGVVVAVETSTQNAGSANTGATGGAGGAAKTQTGDL